MMVFLVAGCATLVQDPIVKINSTNIIGIDTAGVDVEFIVGIENPNPFDLELLDYTFDLQVMTLPFSHGESKMKFTFPSGRKASVRLPMRVKYSDMIEIIKRHPDLDKVPYSLNARFNVKTPVGEMSVPVERNDSLSVPEAYRPATYLKSFMQSLGDMR